MVIATVHVGSDPIALGQFIGKAVSIKSDEANTNLVPIDNINLNKSSKSWEKETSHIN